MSEGQAKRRRVDEEAEWTLYTGVEYFSRRKDIRRVRVAPNVSKIGDNAFRGGCLNLVEVDLCNVTEIGRFAFYKCSRLNRVDLSKVVAFRYCKSLEDISIPPTLATIGSCAFASCEGLVTVTLTGGLQEIGCSAFSGCNSLKHIEIPSSVTRIGYAAFWYCSSLTSVKLSDGLQEIGASAFQYCSSLKQISIPSSVIKIGNGAFSKCSNLASVDLTDGLQEIGALAFENCSSLKQISIPSSVIKIESGAFSECSTLASVKLFDGLQEIGGCAFQYCTSLKHISIPSSVIKIESGAFSKCSSLHVAQIAHPHAPPSHWGKPYHPLPQHHGMPCPQLHPSFANHVHEPLRAMLNGRVPLPHHSWPAHGEFLFRPGGPPPHAPPGLAPQRYTCPPESVHFMPLPQHVTTPAHRLVAVQQPMPPTTPATLSQGGASTLTVAMEETPFNGLNKNGVSLERTVAQLREEKQRLVQQIQDKVLQTTAVQLKNVSQKSTSLERTVAQLRKENQRLVESCESLANECSGKELGLAESEQSLKGLRQEVDETKVLHGEEIMALERTVAKLTSEKQCQEQKLQTQEVAVAQLSKDNEQLVAKCDSLSDECSRKETKISALRTESRDVRGSLAKSEKSLKDKQERLKASHGSQSAKINALEGHVALLESEKQSLADYCESAAQQKLSKECEFLPNEGKEKQTTRVCTESGDTKGSLSAREQSPKAMEGEDLEAWKRRAEAAEKRVADLEERAEEAEGLVLHMEARLSCPVCFHDREKMYAMTPCGHRTCMDCYWSWGDKCFTCERKSKRLQRVFF